MSAAKISFGKDDKVQVGLYLPRADAIRFKLHCVKHGVSQSEIIRHNFEFLMSEKALPDLKPIKKSQKAA